MEDCFNVSASCHPIYCPMSSSLDWKKYYILPIKISSEKQKGIEIIKEGFLDCGVTGKFIDQNYAKANGLEIEQLEKPLKV